MADIDTRSPLAKARDDWFVSKEGRDASNGATLGMPSVAQPYFRNRLELAFLAGANAQWEIDQQKINGLEHHLRELLSRGIIMIKQIIAPWTPEQVAELNADQQRVDRHPFTCPNGHGSLYAAETGWHCAQCHYIQKWAWSEAKTPEDE